MKYQLYLIGLIAFAVLFLLSRGTFASSAHFLSKKIPHLSELTSETMLKNALMLLFVFHLLGLLAAYASANGDTASAGYIVRNEHGMGESSKTLIMEKDGKEEPVRVRLPERELSEKETKHDLKEASDRLPSLVLGGMPASHVDGDLNFPESIDDLYAEITYMTSDPDLVDWNGALGESIPKEGASVIITAKITVGDASREKELALTVFPEKLSRAGTLAKTVNSWISANNDETRSRVSLPSTLDGEDVSWSQKSDNRGPWILTLGWLSFSLLLYSEHEKHKKEQADVNRLLLIDYPYIVSRFSLLLEAGLSLKRALGQITKRYLKSLRSGGEKRPGFELLIKAQEAMSHGESELAAYREIGRATDLMEYKNFSNLLVQNLTLGGREMLVLMRKEADRSLMDRRARAGVLGDEAGTKLLFPMMLLLGVVMAILMVPAMLSFGV
ncbi:MAG: hypothetical protein VZR02_02360 [Lachnospiraceae bacterium]|nr:hypothetical protein [Lachnospiraceae bacterium]